MQSALKLFLNHIKNIIIVFMRCPFSEWQEHNAYSKFNGNVNTRFIDVQHTDECGAV